MYKEVLQTFRHNLNITDAWSKAYSVVNDPQYRNIICSVSGGSDSDIMMDLIHKVDKDNKVTYVYIDTGLEYTYTKEHIQYLIDLGYDIQIYKPKVPIPLAVSRYGQPFISKYVSSNIERLQGVGFTFEDIDYESAEREYHNCNTALKWWCNKNKGKRYNIEYNRWLKEFLLENQLNFKVSSKCCDYAKKDAAYEVESELHADLVITGIRKQEGGIRSMAYDRCFYEKNIGPAKYMPLFWMDDADKKIYKRAFNIRYSRLYEDYHFKRTGCVCCPFGYTSGLLKEMQACKEFDPQLYKACCNVFKNSYEYTIRFLEYRSMKREEWLEDRYIENHKDSY